MVWALKETNVVHFIVCKMNLFLDKCSCGCVRHGFSYIHSSIKKMTRLELYGLFVIGTRLKVPNFIVKASLKVEGGGTIIVKY